MKSKVFHKRELLNIKLNIMIAGLILFFGVTSIFVSAMSHINENFLFEFRYMTLNGTVFTTLISLITLILSVIQLRRGVNYESTKLYYLRLSSAVTEGIIATVILMSFFPSVPDNPNIFTYDSFCMHVLIPLLAVTSFLLNKSPVAYMSPLSTLNCAWLITLYAIVVISMILGGVIPDEKIPYSFLNFNTQPIYYIFYFGVFIYSFAYVLSFLFAHINRKMAGLWQNPINSE